MTPKERLYATLRGEKRDRTPVAPIFMMWAGHFIGRTYRDYYLDGNVMAASQIAVAKRFNLDQVMGISDPWREADDFGMKFDYPPEGVGIPLGRRLDTPEDFDTLKVPEQREGGRMRDRLNAVRIMAKELGRTHSVLGWVEGPLAEYEDLRGMEGTMFDLMDEPRLFHRAAEVIVANAIERAKEQIKAGADMIGVGDAVASLVGPEVYKEHVLPWEKKLFAAIHDAGAAVRLHVCGNIRSIIGDMATTGADIIDVDWMVPLAEARAEVGPQVTLCGNFDPTSVLFQGTPEKVESAARRCLRDGGDRFILQPGCEVPPMTAEANIDAFTPGPACRIADALAR
ncbi:MAG: uroporphyrinogen decarboxylase family protein [Phycisphaeraceae bacterium]|nr:uroporphyrinogen decarboxylase family protein [Phycisphaeraceae bacterium]